MALAAKLYYKDIEVLLDKINSIMKKCKTLKIAGELRERTDLCAVMRNVTRWSSTYEMVQRYLILREFIDIGNPEIAVLMPTIVENGEIETMVRDMKDFESVTKHLQKEDGVTLSDVRTLFDALIVKYPQCCERHLTVDAHVVHNPDFDAGIIRIINGESHLMTVSEKFACRAFLKNAPDVEEVYPAANGVGSPPSFAKNALGAKRARVEILAEYDDCAWIPATSNIVERLFSRAKLTLGTSRKHMDPVTLEMILLLTVNRNLWSVKVVHDIINDKDNHY